MAYAKPDSERGYIGAWMRRERLARKWHIKDVVSALSDLDPELEVREDYIRYLEAGPRKPGPVLLAALCRIFGSEPEPFDEASEPLGQHDQVVAALKALTDEVAGLRRDLAGLRGQTGDLKRLLGGASKKPEPFV